MGPSTTRKEKKAATRERLRRAGRACLETHGFEATSVAQIVEAAGVAHGTFYIHFASKEALADELLTDLNGELRTLLAPVIARAPTRPIEVTIRACAEVYLDHFGTEARFIEAYVQRSLRGLGIASARDGINAPMAALLSATLSGLAADRDGAPDLDWDLAARGILATWLRIGLQYLLGDGISKAEAVEVLTRLSTGALHGLLEPAPTPRPNPDTPDENGEQA